MARVYSWEVSKNPTKYAYIVNPKDTNKVYIGSEPLTGNNLEKVKKWTTDCTDEEYETQFQKMVTLCAEKGFNVEFETASAYMNVDAPCDNLRGPAGRGIDHIALHSKDNVTRISKYIIYYDDGTTDAFEIQNGIDGKNGIDGTPGAQGDSGVSSKLVMIYTSGKDDYGNTFTPERPTGGSYNFAQSKFTDCPDGWFTSDTNENNERLTPPIWMSNRVFSSTVESTDKEWSQPVQITGEKGEAGADGVTTEFIYYLHDNEPSVENLPSLNEAGYVPPIETGWTASPTGVDEDHLTEWCSLRKINSKTNEWGPWEKPFIWSKYGVNGQDGDGVQYIYLKNAGAIVDNPTPADYQTSQDYQSKDNEWVPQAGITYTNIDGKNVCYTALEEVEGDITPAGVWSDNPSDLTGKYHSQWVSSRKYRKNQTSGKMEWGAFSAPALWARFGQDGKNATSIRKLYALSTSTSNPPQLPGDSTTTGDWGTGFPIDYQVGVNVVWGTEAEIWAHNSEFVKSYKIVSGIDADGNVVPPTDVTTTNFKDVDSIPDEEVAGYKYLRFNGNYYEWTGGWCQPYLVTGLKGESGYAPNYTIYVFAYGYTNYPPTAPTGNDPEAPGTSTDELNSIITWMDFPNTSGGRIDGAINEVNGEKQRWYQCVGHVYGHNNEVYEWGTVVPCSGQDGAQGGKGDYMEVRFGITEDTTKPLLIEFDEYDNVYREPQLFNEKGEQMGWYATDTELPDIPLGGTMWQIWALIDGATDTVKENAGRYWNGPKRVSGEKGEQGIQGPTGMRGVTGIPGAKSIQMYCLGTYGKNENSECYWETGGIDGGDGYFGSTNWKNNVLQNKMDGWFIAKEMPYSDPLTAYNEADLIHLAKQPVNKGRVVKLTETIETNVGPSGSESSFTQTNYTYWLINSDSTYTQLTQTLTSDEDFDVYVWCIQGNEKWEVGVHKKYVNITKYDEVGDVIKPEGANDDNTIELTYIPSKQQELYEYVVCDGKYYEWREINGDEVEHRLAGIEWGSPFKLQGTNGLRGLQGTRGQVVYPMGVYNQEEVYITTADKAPYVYDSNDGMYYVYDNTVIPWVGVLPGYDPETKVQGDLYKTIMVHPDDASSSFLSIDYDPATNQKEEVTTHKYLYYDGKYYIWNGSSYSMASRYKYSIDGSGNEGTWMTSQHGDSPANNYANATNSYNTPSWVRFESFKALYTSIGIIENGMIGSAVYNNEFMFSQQGYKRDGVTPTNYAVVSGTSTEYGFLSGYEYDEYGERNSDGAPTGRHWKYRGTSKYINNTDVNPYEKNTSGEYIHTFLPNVCINFSTGQMWLSAGQIKFGGNYRNIYTDTEVNTNVKNATDALNTSLTNNINTLKEQVDKRADTYYGQKDPSEGWQINNKAETATYAEYRVGDLWYNTKVNKSYVFATSSIDGKTLTPTNKSLQGSYYWVESDVPDEVYNRINSRSKIFVDQPSAPYYIGDLWFVHSNDYIKNEFYDGDKTTITGINKGTCMVCMKSSDETFNTKHWGKRDKYADEADVKNAKDELDNMTDQLDNWANDNLLSPLERQSLKNEYNSIVAEYNSILEQAKTVALENTTNYTEYSNAYTKVKEVLEYYTNPANIKSGTDCVEISYEDTKNNKNETLYRNYEHIKTYYEKRQLLLQTISDTLNTNAESLEDELGKTNDKLDEWANDDYICPTERRSLLDTLNSIQAEYSDILQQAKNADIKENNSVYKEYDAAYKKVVSTLEYYTDKNNVEKGTDYIIIRTEGDYNYDNIKTYYEKRQLLLRKISDTLKGEIDDTNEELTSYIQTNDLFLAQVGQRLTDAETGITTINQSGFVAEDDFAEMFSTKVLKDTDGNVIKELKSFIKTEADKITISSEDIFINGNTYINGQFKIDTDGDLTVQNATIENCNVTNVAVTGSIASPFVLDDDTEKVDNVYHDNFSFYTNTDYELTTTFGNNLKWDVTQSGRKVTMVNHKWNNQLSIGRVKINTPSYFNLPYVGYWERDTTLTNKSSGISSLGITYFEAYTLESFYPTRSFYGSQDLFQFQIPPGRTSYSIYIKNEKILYNADYDFADNNYVIVSNINKEIPYTSGDGETPVTGTNVKQVLKLTNGSYTKITFSNITAEKAIVSIAVKQHSPETNKYITTLLLPKFSQDKMFFYENGQAKQSITLSRELVNLIGYGDSKNFYGWIVENRADIETRYLYGKNLKTLAFGCIRYIKVNKVMTIDKDVSYVCTFDGTPVSIGRYATGKYQIGFDSSWNDTLSYCTVLTSGYGLVTDANTNTSTSKATHMPFTSGKISGISNGIEIWVSDDASLNDGGFYFLMTNYSDLPTLRYTDA